MGTTRDSRSRSQRGKTVLSVPPQPTWLHQPRVKAISFDTRANSSHFCRAASGDCLHAHGYQPPSRFRSEFPQLLPKQSRPALGVPLHSHRTSCCCCLQSLHSWQALRVKACVPANSTGTFHLLSTTERHDSSCPLRARAEHQMLCVYELTQSPQEPQATGEEREP